MLVWDERPLFGRGFTFFEQYVQGNSAAAVLFLPVFWELGIGGVLLYFMFILTVFYGAERPGFSAIMALGILVSIGLPYSTFQATALVLVLTALKIKKSLFQSS